MNFDFRLRVNNAFLPTVLHKAALNGSFEACIGNMNCR